MTTTTKLGPSKFQSQKSFYYKAKVLTTDDGTEYLQSYSTLVLKRYPTGKVVRLWDGWSATTGRHIAAFVGINKKEFSMLERETLSKEVENITMMIINTNK